MPYKDKIKQLEYQRKWMAKRRQDWLDSNGPCKCGSWDNLEVDHIDPNLKIDHKVWSWTEEKRNAELAKCQVLCYICHLAKTIESRRVVPEHGTLARYKSDYAQCRCIECKKANAEYEHSRRGYSIIGKTSPLQGEVGRSIRPTSTKYPGVAQSGSASRLGREGRRFESCHPDQYKGKYERLEI